MTTLIHAQRRNYDCGVAALAGFLGVAYEDAYVAAIAASATFRSRQGLSIPDMIAMARGFGRTLTRTHYKRVDLEEHVGILGVNWDRSVWRKHGSQGHWVILRAGTIIDPSGPCYSDAADYLITNKGRAGTLLREA